MNLHNFKHHWGAHVQKPLSTHTFRYSVPNVTHWPRNLSISNYVAVDIIWQYYYKLQYIIIHNYYVFAIFLIHLLYWYPGVSNGESLPLNQDSFRDTTFATRLRYQTERNKCSAWAWYHFKRGAQHRTSPLVVYNNIIIIILHLLLCLSDR